MTSETKSKRGFASMTPERRREIASQGGKSAHAQGKAHRFSTEEAKAAGKKGGRNAHASGKAHQFTPTEASAAGKKARKKESAVENG